MTKTISKKELMMGMETMNAFGPRLTGNKSHSDFIAYLKNEIKNMGIDIYSDPFYFKRWEEKSSSLSVIKGDGEEDIPIASAYPYSGQTGEKGVVGELCYVDSLSKLSDIKGKIAVFDVKNINFLPSELAFDKRSSYPEDVVLPAKYEGPVATSFIQFAYGMISKLAKAKAVVLIWRGLSDECIKGQYLSFILGYQKIPMLWIDSTQGEKLCGYAAAHKQARLVLRADIEDNALTETFYCILKGKNEKENIIINTHTDGTNCVEENGSIALLQLMKILKDRELERTHIFVFTTGHFRLPHFKDIRTGAFQASSRWLAMHRPLWDGKGDHLKCVANLTVEHLGCMEWRDCDGKYLPTGEIDVELVYTGNEIMDKLYIEAVKDRELVRTMTLRGHNALHFGEGQNFFTMGVPGVHLVPAPYYLCAVSDGDEMDKFSIDLMYEQTETFLKLIDKFETMKAEDFGRSDFYSFVKAKSVSGGENFDLKGFANLIKRKLNR